LQGQVFGFIHDTHSTFAEFLQDPVMGNRLPGHVALAGFYQVQRTTVPGEIGDTVEAGRTDRDR
jgi:hypothetical protein